MDLGRFRAGIASAACACVCACASGPDQQTWQRRTDAVRGPGANGRAGFDPGPAPLAATTGADPSLGDYVRLALLHDPGIQAAFEDWRAALVRVDQLDALPDPRLTWGHFIESIETRTGPQLDRVSIAQTFPWFGKLSGRGDVAARHAEALWWKVEARRTTVVRAVQSAWFDYAFLGRDVRIARDNLDLLRSFEPVVQRRVQGGAPQAQLLQLQVEIVKVEDLAARLQAYRPAVSARLMAFLNRREPEPLPWPELTEPELDAFDLGEARRRLLQRNPELLEIREAVERERRRAEVAELEGMPDLTVGVDYFHTGPARIPNVAGSGDDPWGLSLSMNLPFGRAKYDALVEEAEHSRAAALRRFDQKANELHAELRMALYRFDDASRQIALYRDTLLPRARQALRLTQAAYENGGASLLEVIDRQRALLAFEQSYWRACAELGRSRADVDALTGVWVEWVPADDGGER